MGDSIYFPTYSIPSEMNQADAEWLEEQQGDGPLRLEDVTDVCAAMKVKATLRDAHGFVNGYVSEDGSYRL